LGGKVVAADDEDVPDANMICAGPGDRARVDLPVIEGPTALREIDRAANLRDELRRTAVAVVMEGRCAAKRGGDDGTISSARYKKIQLIRICDGRLAGTASITERQLIVVADAGVTCSAAIIEFKRSRTIYYNINIAAQVNNTRSTKI